MKKDFSRRAFIKQNTLLALGAALPYGISTKEQFLNVSMAGSQIERIENEIILHGRKNNFSWFAPAIGVIPGIGNKTPQVFVNVHLLTGNDIGPQLYLRTDDLGKTWTNPILCQNWFKVPLKDDVFESPGFGFFYHIKTGRLIAIGSTHFVQDEGNNTSQKNEKHFNSPELKRSIIYSFWNPQKSDFEPWERMKIPPDISLSIFSNGQFHELDDGSILIPGYYQKDTLKYRGVTILRCKFNGRELQFIEHGNIHSVTESRGLAEPSMIHFEGKYFMTIRHDLRSYVTASKDGLQYNEIKPWLFDDGEDLGNYNTQQKWLKHKEKLYLIYNRKSELNNGVFRSRAPLFMAEVDTEHLRVQRNTERIVFPEKGARMGNFNVAYPTEKESWIITGEWLEGKFSHVREGDRFWVNRNEINYIQYIGDLLLARIHWK